MASESFSSLSVPEDVVGLGCGYTGSVTMLSVQEDIRLAVSRTASTASLRQPFTNAPGHSPPCGMGLASPIDEYEEDFEDYSGSDDGGHERPANLMGKDRARKLQSHIDETPVGINGRFSSAIVEVLSPELSPSWDDFEEHSEWSPLSPSVGSAEQSPPVQKLRDAPTNKARGRALVLDVDEIDNEQSVSTTWSVGVQGSLRHKPSGTRVTVDDGVTFEGRVYRLTPEDIELAAEGEETTRLGAGACGVVSRGTIRLTGAPVAIKTISVEDKTKRDQMLNEIRGLVQAEGCPNLVQWYAGFVSKVDCKVHVVLEFMDRGSLKDLLAKLHGDGVLLKHLPCMASQMICGLCHLHDRSVLHRDIKPANVLHNQEGEVKLTDFGIAKDLHSPKAMACTFVGTATYMAPERCLGEDYSLGSDIWSIGMVFFELAAGKYPFHDVSSFPTLMSCLCDRPEPRLDSSRFPASCCDFLARCLTREVRRRADAASLSKHPYIVISASAAVDALRSFAKWLEYL